MSVPAWRIRPPEYPSFAREKAMLSKSPPCQQPAVTVTHQQNRIALFWLTTAVGAVLFVTLQSFSYVNDYGGRPLLAFTCSGETCKVSSQTPPPK